MQFEYFYQMTPMGIIDVEDIGNFCLSCTNTLYEEFILIVKTEEGKTTILQWGPWTIDMELPPVSCTLSYRNFDFRESKIKGAVDKLLNGNYCITQATLITLEEAKSRIKDLVSYI